MNPAWSGDPIPGLARAYPAGSGLREFADVRFAWILDGIDLTPGFTSRSPMIPQRREETSQFHVVAGSAWASVDGGTIIVGHVASILLWTDAECGSQFHATSWALNYR